MKIVFFWSCPSDLTYSAAAYLRSLPLLCHNNSRVHHNIAQHGTQGERERKRASSIHSIQHCLSCASSIFTLLHHHIYVSTVDFVVVVNGWWHRIFCAFFLHWILTSYLRFAFMLFFLLIQWRITFNLLFQISWYMFLILKCIGNCPIHFNGKQASGASLMSVNTIYILKFRSCK